MALFIPYLYAKGGVWVSSQRDPTNQVFNHKDLAGVWRHYHINTLKFIVSDPRTRAKAVEIGLEAHNIQHVMETSGIEVEHFDRITPEFLEQPGIVVHFPTEDSHLVVDGNHRYVRRFQLGYPTMKFWQLSEEQANGALLDLPPGLFSNRPR
jgi:hypothetical protein